MTENENTNWLQNELKELPEGEFDGDRVPAITFPENKIVTVLIDFTKPFDRWDDVENKTIKKIIPVAVNGESLVWWLNVKNPTYRKLVELGTKGKTEFKIMRTGEKKNTRYVFVNDDDQQLPESPIKEVASIQG